MYAVEGAGHDEVGAPASAHESALLKVVKQGDQRVPATIDIKEDDGAPMVADGLGGRHGEDLVERADATGQGDEGIGLVHEQRLAVGKVVAWYFDVEVAGASSALLDDGWDDTDRSPALVFDGTGHTLHQSRITSAEDKGVAFAGHPFTQLSRQTEVFRIDLVVGGAENSNLHRYLCFGLTVAKVLLFPDIPA